MANWVLNDSQAIYKLIIRIPMELIKNLCFICVRHMIICISIVNIIVYLLSCYCNRVI
jgi:hypothetical protein